ncbi:hypothetical protein D3226_10380 [Leucobacter chromiireducens subsp. chromiireducens]|uniref:Sce7726 family protein n=2 Tax=Leucobacter TaxID=55968 RepID=A0ABS1SS77_9MICO|nr:hypothetical protein [Leucobacter chromiireducens subsp. chromiireducens]
MLSEFSIGMSRADLVLLNGTAMVYELKSERDSLTRLQGQMDDYRRVFAAATVLTDQKHLLKVEKLVDASVGLAVLTARGRISEIRPAAPTPERIDPSAVLDALRLQEALDVLRRMEIEAPDTTNTKIRGCIRSLFKGIDPVELHSALVEVLKSSRSLSPLKQLIPSLPDSLIAAVLPLGFKKESQWEKLLGSMETPLAEVMKWK